jgi:probable rRNA maturation factor
MSVDLGHDIIIESEVAEPLWSLLPLSLEVFAEETIKTTLRRVAPYMESCEVSVLLTGDKQIQELNRHYRGRDKPTNILSFGSYDHPIDATLYKKDAQKGVPMILGDLILSYHTVLKETQEQNKLLEHHLRHLIVHGVLHLLGYDHVHDEDARVMEDLEIEILEPFGIVNPYLIQD